MRARGAGTGTGRHAFTALLAALLVVAASGCWAQVGYDAQRHASNPFEVVVSARSLRRLAPAWQAPLPDGAHDLVVARGRAFTPSGPDVVALDLRDGSQAWAADHALSPGGTFPYLGAPLVVDGSVEVPWQLGSFGSGVFVHDAQTGTFTDEPGGGVAAAPLLADGSPAWVRASGGSFGVLQEVVWDDHLVGYLTFGSGSTLTDPSAAGDRLFLGRDDTVVSFVAGCTPATWPSPVPWDGDCVADWTAPLAGRPTTPIPIAGGRLAVADGSGTLSVLDAATGAVVWTADLGAPAAAPPTVERGRVHAVTTAGTLLTFPEHGCGAATCAPEWTAALGGAVHEQPASAGGAVFAVTDAGTVVGVDGAGCHHATCTPEWAHDLDATPSGPPVVADAHLLVPTDAGVEAFAPRR